MKEIDKAKEDLQQQLEALYTVWRPTGQTVRINSKEIHEQKKQAAIDAYHARLRSIMANSQNQKQAAQQTLSKADRVQYDWLTTEEITRAAQLSDMVSQDLDEMTPKELNSYIEGAADNGDRAYRFAVLRQARAAWHKAVTTDHPETLNPFVAHSAQKALTDLRATLAPSMLLKAEKEAQETLYTADRLYRAAEYELPEGRQRMSDALGIDAQYLPEEMPEAEAV